MDSPDAADTSEYIRQREELADKQEDFMRKHLRRSWPKRLVAVVGVLQLLVSLAIFGVDLPVILMYAPRWQVLTGVWTFIFGFIASVSTLHSTRKVTWKKLQVAVALNVLGALVAAIMLIFNIIFASNPYTCIIASGCSYLKYTYSQAVSFYVGEIVLGIILIAAIIVFIVFFIKYGIGGKARFDNIQRGYAPTNFHSMGQPRNNMSMNPRPGPGNMMNRPPRPGFMPRNPGQMPRGMMGRPPGPMMPGPRGPMMGGGPRGPMQQNYRQPGPYPTHISSLANYTAHVKMTEHTRQLVSEWIHQEKYNHKGDMKRKFYADLAHAKGVIKVAAADAKVTEETRKWVAGYLAATGVPEEVLDLAEKYKPNIEDGTVPYHSKSGLEHAKYGQLWLFYDGFCAASAGGELSPDKITAIYALAKKMIIDEEKIKQVQGIVEQEEKLRQKRLELLFPNGFDTAVKEVEMEQ